MCTIGTVFVHPSVSYTHTHMHVLKKYTYVCSYTCCARHGRDLEFEPKIIFRQIYFGNRKKRFQPIHGGGGGALRSISTLHAIRGVCHNLARSSPRFCLFTFYVVIMSAPEEEEESCLFDVCKMDGIMCCLLYTSPSPRDRQKSRMPSSA